MIFVFLSGPGWQKLCERASGARRKVWTRTKILIPNIRYFVAILRFVAIYTFYKPFIELYMQDSFLSSRFRQKSPELNERERPLVQTQTKDAQKQRFLLQICKYRQKQCFCREELKAFFALAESQLLPPCNSQPQQKWMTLQSRVLTSTTVCVFVCFVCTS